MDMIGNATDLKCYASNNANNSADIKPNTIQIFRFQPGAGRFNMKYEMYIYFHQRTAHKFSSLTWAYAYTWRLHRLWKSWDDFCKITVIFISNTKFKIPHYSPASSSVFHSKSLACSSLCYFKSFPLEELLRNNYHHWFAHNGHISRLRKQYFIQKTTRIRLFYTKTASYYIFNNSKCSTPIHAIRHRVWSHLAKTRVLLIYLFLNNLTFAHMPVPA